MSNCFSEEINIFLRLSIKVPIFVALTLLVTDILVPLLRKLINDNDNDIENEEIDLEPFLLRLFIAVAWPAFLCTAFNFKDPI